MRVKHAIIIIFIAGQKVQPVMKGKPRKMKSDKTTRKEDCDGKRGQEATGAILKLSYGCIGLSVFLHFRV